MNARRLSISMVVLSALSAALLLSRLPAAAGEKHVKNPTLEDQPDGTKKLLMPDDIWSFLQKEFPNCRIPDEKEFDPEMVAYYRSRLIGVHPAVAYGDFNGDKKRDYMLLLITGDTKWGPLCELIACNATRGGYEASRLGEIYNFKEDYVSFADNKLYKGRYKKGGWYINWDKKNNTYTVTKS